MSVRGEAIGRIRRGGSLAALALLAACGSGSDNPAAGTGQDGLPSEARFLNDDPSCPAPRCFELDIPLPSGVSVTDNRVRVIVPEGYTTSGKRYPLLYLLHDAPGNYLSWTQLGGAVEALKDVDVIAVMPDGGGGNPGWYSNWESGEFQWETYHIEVLIPYVEQRLRGLGAGHRAVAGPSMGGFGSMSYSARHPGLFKAAAGFSGAVDFLVLDRISALVGFLGNPVAGTPNGPIWGDPVTNYAVWQDHDPGTHVDGLAGMTILLTSGNGLPGGPHEQLSSPQLYSIEPLILLMNTSFAQTLEGAGVEHQTLFYGPGFHDWPYYRDGFAWALPQLMAAIAP
ncbi:MAG TPA: alpha/beta hydrolase family protein [Solimonas sp.]|nr:alpha/beta hydrolase family protein [Solimonas sp.]